MGFDVLDTGFIGSLTTEEGGGGGGSCSTPNASYTGLAINQSTITWPVSLACYRSPILIATAVSHSLSSDTNLRFWVNCKLGNDTSSTFGAAACSDTGNTLVQGKLYTKAQLLAGIDLLAADSVNAAAQDASDDIAIGWEIYIAAVDISSCSSSICTDSPTTISAIESFPYNGPSLYTDGSGTFPQFETLESATTMSDTGSTYDNVIQVMANVSYYTDSMSMGDDSFSAGAFKVEIQYDTSCDTSGGCSSYTWIDGIDNDTSLAAGDGGSGYEQTFDVVEADCWNEDYIFIRVRIVAQGSCGTTLAGAWTQGYLGEFDVFGGTVDCSGGGGGPPPPP
jgi:hypothetical protein